MKNKQIILITYSNGVKMKVNEISQIMRQLALKREISRYKYVYNLISNAS